MKRVRSILVLLVLALLLCTLAACTQGGGEPFDAGTPLTPSDVNDLKDKLLKGEEKEPESGEQTPDSTPQVPEGETVYWLSGGSVYHKDSTCYHIKEKPNVQSGTAAQAVQAGKDRLCSACGD